MALPPPPSQIFSPSFRICDMRSARNRMLASKRAEVGSTLVVKTFDGCGEVATGGSLRSAMGRRSGLITVYQPSRSAQTAFRRQRGDAEPQRNPGKRRDDQ